MLRGQPSRRAMPRGSSPGRPAKTGRHEAARTQIKPQKSAQRSSPKALVSKPIAVVKPAPKSYNSTSPERVAEILKRLDQLYPDVTCALTHQSAWELLVATILSAQSTDVRVNI